MQVFCTIRVDKCNLKKSSIRILEIKDESENRSTSKKQDFESKYLPDNPENFAVYG